LIQNEHDLAYWRAFLEAGGTMPPETTLVLVAALQDARYQASALEKQVRDLKQQVDRLQNKADSLRRYNRRLHAEAELNAHRPPLWNSLDPESDA